MQVLLLHAWFMAISFLLVDHASGEVAAMFVFGDSLMDPGNNNDLLSLAKANYYPHGIDFPGGATGRFCNGKLVPDFLADELGLPLLPPFNHWRTRGSKLLHGVNFASSASGILNDTGDRFGMVWPMDKQIQNFIKTLRRLRWLVKNVEEFVAKSLVLVSIGSNDYLTYYYSLSESQPPFHDIIIREYTRQLKELYALGGRKFLVAGLGPLGCTPNVIANRGKNKNECVNDANKLASEFNVKLELLTRNLNADLNGSCFRYWDLYSTTLKTINDPSSYGFKYTHKACCATRLDELQLFCPPFLPKGCTNRSEFVFWDPFHPTQASNAILANDAYQLIQNPSACKLI